MLLNFSIITDNPQIQFLRPKSPYSGLSGQQTVFLEDLFYGFKRVLHLLARMGSHKGVTNQSVVGSHSGRYHRIHEYALVQQIACHTECLVVIADKQRYDRCLSMPYLKTHLTEALKSEVGDVPKVFLTLRLGEHNVQRGVHGGYAGRGDAGCEDV